ncbi:MAG: hypothetical protein WD767_01735 [Alphaproteobacteria bacterium]
MDVLAVPQYLLPNLFNNHEEILVGAMQRSSKELALISDICEIEPYRIVIPPAIRSNSIGTRALEYLTRRFGITKLANKAVVLFDIVGFSRYSPLEQVTALNSLSYSINVAYQRTVENKLDVSLCHSTTGDGFYVWNRAEGVDANIDLFCFLMLVLADNSLGQRKGIATTVPVLRTGFHVGDCFEYFLAEGARPGTGSYIVGNATIQLARMVEIALQNQILIGDFKVTSGAGAGVNTDMENYDAVAFLEKAQKRLIEFKDVNLSREKVSGIKCYLTGHAEAGGKFNICRYRFSDKHNFQHSVFNAKVNVYRANNEQIFLGRLTKDLTEFSADEIILRPDAVAGPSEVAVPVPGTAE